MLTLTENRVRFYKIAYVFSLISLIFYVGMVFIILLASFSVFLNFAIFLCIILLVIPSIMFHLIKKAYKTAGTDQETDHITLAICSLFFMPASSIFLLIAISMYHE